MPRILYLLSSRDCSRTLPSPARGRETAATVALLKRGLGGTFELAERSIGEGGAYRNMLHAALSLRREQGFDLVHAWGLPALAAGVMGTRAPLLYTPTQPIRPHEAGWLRAISTVRPVDVLCPTATIRRHLVERGISLERCHLVRPAVDFAAIRGRRDPALRQRLGLREDDVAILAPGPTDDSARHSLALWAMSMLHLLDGRYRLLVEGTGPKYRQLERFARSLGGPDLLVSANGVPPGHLPGAADAAICTSVEHAPVLPICTCMAAGLPIVSTVTHTAAELLEDRHNALLVTEASPRLLARRMMDLFEDKGLRWKIADAARSEAFEFLSPSRLTQQHRIAYEMALAGQQIVIPETPPGAGSRFMGRA